MKKFIVLKGLIVACLFIALISGRAMAQDFAAALPQNILRPAGPNTCNIHLSGNLIPEEFFIPDYNWTVSPSVGVSISHPDHSIAQATAIFTSAATGIYTFTLTRGIKDTSINVSVGNLAAASNNGLDISVFNVLNGVLTTGAEPGFMFDPLPDVTTTAALGVAINGYYYYMPNAFNNGNVTLYAASPDGQTTNAVASVDLNGSSNNNLGFVRLAIDAMGKGWILAGDGITVYLASFTGNGLSSTTINLVDDNVSVAGSTASVFQNGDLCFSANGTIYALANNGGGVTQIFTGTPNGTATTVTKKWDLVDADGNNFNGNVNGVAFDLLGSLYISTGGVTGGLYFIDQNTVNTATGTVQCSLVWGGLGLTDLASNLFPQQTTLPVRLMTFTANYRNQVATLNWETEGEQHFNYFEIQRSNNGNNYTTIGVRPSSGNGDGRRSYQFPDNLSSVSGNTFTYRLKLVDTDGKFKYSNVIMIRKGTQGIKGIIINPNPIMNGMATLRFFAPGPGIVNLKVIDISGKIVWQQQVNALEGSNSIALDGLDRLAKGSYILQMVNGEGLQSAKFTVGQ
jgi:hypothetical protein